MVIRECNQVVLTTNLSPTKKDIYVFFHICCINNYIDVTNEVIDELVNSGLYDKASKIYYSVLGNPGDSLKDRIAKLDKFEMIYSSDNLQDVEYPTLSGLHKFCLENDSYVLYIHTKGVSLPHDKFRQLWRKRLIQKVVKEYEVCVSYLNDGCDIAGCGWKQHPKGRVDYNAGDYEHFSGNFWWADSNYISRLPDIEKLQNAEIKRINFQKYRLLCEFWVGMEQCKVGVNGEINKEYSYMDYYSINSNK